MINFKIKLNPIARGYNQKISLLPDIIELNIL